MIVNFEVIQKEEVIKGRIDMPDGYLNPYQVATMIKGFVSKVLYDSWDNKDKKNKGKKEGIIRKEIT